jgi:hypothetical protein
MPFLMLLDVKVYDVTEGKILNRKLCPFKGGKSGYKKWRSARKYLDTNKEAHVIVERFGSKSKEIRRQLSMSDGYWIRHKYDENKVFRKITPYLNDFSEVRLLEDRSAYRSQSSPEATLGGGMPKYWVREDIGNRQVIAIRKLGFDDRVAAEILAIKLARKIGLNTMDGYIKYNGQAVLADSYDIRRHFGAKEISLINLTTPDTSLITLEQMGIEVEGSSVDKMVEAYRKAGANGNIKRKVLSTIIFDAIIGNPDRISNNSNWAVIQNNHTGRREVSPLYDFNTADIKSENNRLDLIVSSIKREGHSNIAKKLLLKFSDEVAEIKVNSWIKNMKFMIEEFSKK